jgi:hypothetical protein
MRMLLYTIFTFCCLAVSPLKAQPDADKLKKKLKAAYIIGDPVNEDGVFIARLKKTNTCGMYQCTDGKKIQCLIPPLFDSVDFFRFNGVVTGVWLNGKVGLYLSPWTSDSAHLAVPCLYDAYKLIRVIKKQGDDVDYYTTELTYVAVKKNGLWAWIDYTNGELKTDFLYDLTKEKMPYPKF